MTCYQFARKELEVNLLVTGATGFVGRALITKMLLNHDYHVSASVRRVVDDIPSAVKQIKIDGISSETDWSSALQDVDCIIHAAARVHVMSDRTADPLKEFRQINTEGTLNLAEQAAESGVKRFIYLSSIKVNGEESLPGTQFTPEDIFVPTDFYALSKYEAEQGLLSISKKTTMEVVIIRPPLVYGPGVKANFLTMMRWLHKGLPLPFGAIKNKRSFIALENLIDFIVTCIEHSAASNQVFLVADGEDMSMSELLTRLSLALGKQPRLLPINQEFIQLLFKLFGKKDLANRICSSLLIDMTKAKTLLNWNPPVSVDKGLKKTAKYFLEMNM